MLIIDALRLRFRLVVSGFPSIVCILEGDGSGAVELSTSRNPIMRPPSYRQRSFVEHDLGGSSGSPNDAARRAGYQWPEKLGPRLVEKSREN